MLARPRSALVRVARPLSTPANTLLLRFPMPLTSREGVGRIWLTVCVRRGVDCTCRVLTPVWLGRTAGRLLAEACNTCRPSFPRKSDLAATVERGVPLDGLNFCVTAALL